jgi:protein-tyrosine phosphatase/membrane-associated phospholipid phosphatase
MRPKALTTSVGLSILFLAVYGGCNWIASHRGHVGSFYFDWERSIPFVPFFILPYLSIDLFFITASFLCRDKDQLRIFSKRVVAAILVAGICFLLFPLRFAFARPSTAGWTGALFDWFRGMDAPYNLVPSLHAALLLLLVDLYARNLRGLVRWAVVSWFVLVGLSPVLTYQHHVIDIVGGFALAGYCFYFFRQPATPLAVTKNPRIGAYYATGALILSAMAIFCWPAGALLLWPIVALIIVALIYFGLGPSIFRKTNGKIPWSTRFALGPCLAGQYLSLIYYKRKCGRWDEVTPRIWIGRLLNKREAAEAIEAGVTAVLDLSAEFSEAGPFRSVSYRNIPILDLTAPTMAQLEEMAGFINEHSRKEHPQGVVYVHCKIGYSRSAAAVAAALISTGEVHDVEEALGRLRRARPSIVIRPEIVSALSRFHYAQSARLRVHV